MRSEAQECEISQQDMVVRVVKCKSDLIPRARQRMQPSDSEKVSIGQGELLSTIHRHN